MSEQMREYPLARTEGLVVEALDDEVLVYDLERHRAHCLNGTAAVVWRGCDGKRSVDDLAALLGCEVGTPVSVELIRHALAELSRRRLLNEAAGVEPGLSRREMLRKAGLAGAAAVAAVPVIKSIVAPTAAQASTCLGPGSSCSSSSECCSGLCSGSTCW